MLKYWGVGKPDLERIRGKHCFRKIKSFYPILSFNNSVLVPQCQEKEHIARCKWNFQAKVEAYREKAKLNPHIFSWKPPAKNKGCSDLTANLKQLRSDPERTVTHQPACLCPSRGKVLETSHLEGPAENLQSSRRAEAGSETVGDLATEEVIGLIPARKPRH